MTAKIRFELSIRGPDTLLEKHLQSLKGAEVLVNGVRYRVSGVDRALLELTTNDPFMIVGIPWTAIDTLELYAKPEQQP